MKASTASKPRRPAPLQEWSLPGGVVELGETVREAAMREIGEECNIEIEIERILRV